ncbi:MULTISPECIES: hypothetical protein [Lysobacter]|uniref:hypothetical protein n=1 Tax=Lysobacter TaxID=68 RepID=UPI001F213B69|nr:MULTISPECIES: hypothetical protein [Lysobacter]UJB21544.1 hypothetical protein L1A79_11030 [Lysobacter capsici]UJQ29339.1 hypothetical protein L2D09_03835 [Lysobacter gummosus]
MPFPSSIQSARCLRGPLTVLFLSFAAVAVVYFPYLSFKANAISDGQFAQFFESSFGWSDLYIGGWPLYADPNSMSFYPLRYLFPATREAFDYFSLAAAGIFALGNGWLAWELTRSRRSVLLAIVAAPGLGFFIAHLGHTSMLHAASYAPFMVLACLRLSQRGQDWALWVALFGLSTALSLLAGHPQVTTYTLAASALMAAPVKAKFGDWVAAYLKAAAGLVLGLGLSAIFLVPAAAFVGESVRNTMSAEVLRQFSLRWFELGLDVFPYLAGGYWEEARQVPYIAADANNSWNENIAYVGVGIFCLVVVGLRGFWADPGKRKILLGLIFSLLLALAPSLPGSAEILAQIPVLSMFRAWSRWQFVSSLFALQLACIALAQLAGEQKTARGGAIYSFIPWLIVPAALVIISASTFLEGKIGVRDLFQGTTLVQIAVLAALGLVIFALRTEWGRRSMSLALLPIVLIGGELVYLSRQATWANAYAMPATAAQIEVVSKTKGILARTQGRLLTLSGWESRYLSPDHTRAAEMPSFNWYGPLLNARFAELSGVTSGGWTRPEVLSESNQVLDIYGVSVVEPYASSSTPASPSRDLLYPTQRWRPLPSPNPGGLLFNNRSLPRVRLVGETVYVNDATALTALKTSRLPDGRTFRAGSMALVDRQELQIAGKADVPRHATDLTGADAFSVAFDAPIDHPLLLIVGDNFSSNWNAHVDGKQVDTARINYNQIGVLLPRGARKVNIGYHDSRLTAGIVASLISIFIACALILFGISRAGRKQPT